MLMIDKYLIEKGYKEFKPTRPYHNDSIVKCFQKRFDDEVGKKYFITINKWDWTWTGRHDMPEYSYEFETQLYQKDTHDPINLTFFSGWEVDNVEQHLEKLWNNEDYDYYEEFY